MSSYKLAQLVGRKREWVVAMQKGKHEPKISTVILFAEALGMEPWELFKETVLAMRQGSSEAEE